MPEGGFRMSEGWWGWGEGVPEGISVSRVGVCLREGLERLRGDGGEGVPEGMNVSRGGREREREKSKNPPLSDDDDDD